VCKAYQTFTAVYCGVPADKDTWTKEGSFNLSCFPSSRPNIGYLIIAVHQGVRQDGCEPKAGLLAHMKFECWKSIAEALLMGLGVRAESITTTVAERTGKELLALLRSSECRVEAYLLSLMLSPEVRASSSCLQ
jgi:hypothetical protein